MSSAAPEGPYGIIGLGLLGGSFALALKRATPAARIVGVDPDGHARAAALAASAIDVAQAEVGSELESCRVVLLATPLPALDEVLATLRPHLAPDALLTDLIGVKAGVAEAVARSLPDARFVGGHPMAGGEQGGFDRAHAELFEGCVVALCPSPSVDSTPLVELWQALGATPVVMPAEAHDREVAVTSHLPYLAAVALRARVATLGAAPRLVGGGLRDATRHASFDPAVMASVCAANPHLPAAARALARELEALADLAEQEPQALSARAAAVRDP